MGSFFPWRKVRDGIEEELKGVQVSFRIVSFSVIFIKQILLLTKDEDEEEWEGQA